VKKRRKRKKARGGSRLQPPLCAVRTGQRLKLVFNIGERKKKQKRKKKQLKYKISPKKTEKFKIHALLFSMKWCII